MPFLTGSVSASEALKKTRQLEVITSFPPEFYTPFVTAFSQRYPDIQVLTLNKKTTASLAEIKRGNPRKFDIFWSSSPDAFAILKAENALRQLSRGRRHEALSIDGVNLDDPDGYFMGFSLSGVGWMWNPAYLEKEGLPIPGQWQDLTDPIYYGHLAMSTPSRSGTTHLIVEGLLQDQGWEKGWGMLLRMAVNLRTVSARSFSVPEGLINGRFGVGLGIDFLAQSRKELGFRYGDPVYLAPAGIAVLSNGKNPAGAELFIDFILSPEGQAILLAPAVSRLPVSRELHLKGEEPELFKMIRDNHSKPYDAVLSQSRYHLVNQLFDRMITYRLPERRKLWKRFLSLEKQAVSMGLVHWPVKEALIPLLTEVPVTEEQSRTPEFTTLFTLASRGSARGREQRKQIQSWETFLSRRLAQAKELLDKAEFDLKARRR
ncbi:ABC transporter substrate-binding protein [Desulfoluna limicola]|uniref:ABC transporter substrate-binding protein n=1 Tax=Desulfoluna limicola TaxID=2810562 RepID=UPI001F3B58D7|nr:extracellular solute-binding protein [Desulfoluna limicola]